MPSTFTWLDHSEHDRRRVLEAVDRFKETDTRDELGLGAIRDAFADLLFPGTSTIQTRARYFLFVPWMYRQLHEKRVTADKVTSRARKEEIHLRDALLQTVDTVGVIGKVAGAALKRLPSNVYWQGLSAWKIRLYPGSQQEYHRYFERLHTADEGGRDDDGESLDGGRMAPWHLHLPPAPDTFPEGADFELRPDEARYIAERICFSAPRSLLAFLVLRGKTVDADYPWAHPQFAEFPSHIQDLLHHGQLLAESLHGAALLYNLMLAEELPPGPHKDERTETFRQELEAWVTELQPRGGAISRWNRADFWSLVQKHARVSGATHRFVEQWQEYAPWQSLNRAADDVSVRRLVRDRERQLKGARARLGNPRALELWNGASGVGRLDYRWPSATRIVMDIHAGLGGRHARA
ncbi:hypothetical protein HJC10_19890 [Corallococcus exiguus]|uniref:DUF6361 family protein n=1 Tax=Corallococcus TaxID=83461 RepID=UPI0011C40893|nr:MULTISPECIES: DUF6361 family protein [Corallococcus]NNB96297.1 hypothetical protein [Corallococcus exiguus]NNC05103.1 hypothetical protein [Corallococcus exiguus]NPC48980.1 hypothetical protein [Corallococcus exiguus]